VSTVLDLRENAEDAFALTPEAPAVSGVGRMSRPIAERLGFRSVGEVRMLVKDSA
jgi:hypothetical protein